MQISPRNVIEPVLKDKLANDQKVHVGKYHEEKPKWKSRDTVSLIRSTSIVIILGSLYEEKQNWVPTWLQIQKNVHLYIQAVARHYLIPT